MWKTLPIAGSVVAYFILVHIAGTTGSTWKSNSRSDRLEKAANNVACQWLCKILRKEVSNRRGSGKPFSLKQLRKDKEEVEEVVHPLLRSQLTLLRLLREGRLRPVKRVSQRVVATKSAVHNTSLITVSASMKLHAPETTTQSKADDATALILDFYIQIKLTKLEVQRLQNGIKIPLTIELSNSSALAFASQNMRMSTPSTSSATPTLLPTQVPFMHDAGHFNEDDVSSKTSPSWLLDAHTKSTFSRPCEASQSDYCFFKGECVFFYSLNITICKCQPGFKGTRCEMYDIMSIDNLPEDNVQSSGQRNEPDSSSERQSQAPQGRNPFDVILDAES